MKKMRFMLAAAALALAGPASAVTLVFQDEFSGGVNCQNLVSGCSVLTATTIAGGVHMSFTGTMAPGEFITSLYGNFTGAFPTVANLAGNTETINGGFSFATDAFKADGDGFFDWKLDLFSGGPAVRFNGNDNISWDFMGVTLQELNSLSVNGPIDKNGFLFATHGQGLVNGGSGWFRGQLAPGSEPFDVTPVPEPETYALFMAGLAAVAYMQRRRKKNQK
jgi:hypothetical protein